MTVGERWAADQLRALRAERFTPAAWARFVGASLRRAAENRSARPELALQARTWSRTGLVVGVLASASARRVRIAAPSPLAWTAWSLASSAMLDWHLGMVEGPNGEPRERLGAPDALTLTRTGLVPFIAAQGKRRDQAALPYAVLLAASAITDILDGRLARRRGTTRLGRDLDAASDVLVGLAATGAARRAGWLTPGATRLALARHALPPAVVTVTYLHTGHRKPHAPSRAGQWASRALRAGLILSPAAPRLASAVISWASAATLACASRRYVAEPASQ